MSSQSTMGRGFGPLFVAQGLSAFGDNILRNAAAVMVMWAAHAPGWLVAVAAAAFVAPTALLSGLGGELADRMDKARLARLLKLAELPVAAVAATALVAGSLTVAMLALLASGMLAALFGPVKYGILPELVPAGRVAAANAWVEGATFAAILTGSVGGTLLAAGGGGRLLAALLVVMAATCSFLAAGRIPRQAAGAPDLRVRPNVLGSTVDLLRELHADRPSWRAALGNAWFWTLGAVVLSLLPGLARDTLSAGPAMNAVFLGLFTAGVACGSAAAAFLAGARIVLLPAALGSALCGVSLMVVWLLTAGGPSGAHGVGLYAALFLAAAGAGLIAVPTQAAVQSWAAHARRARAVAGTNVLSAVGMVAGTAALTLAQRAGTHEPALLGATGALALLAAPVMALRMPANPLGEAAWMLARLLFRVELRGAGHLPGAGQAAVITPNHVSWLDAALMFAVCEKPPLFAIDASVAELWWVRPFLRLVPTLRVAGASPFAVRRMVEAVRDGANLVIFPEGRISETGWLMEIQNGAATVADRAGAPVVPVIIEGLERTRFSRLSAAQTRRAWLPRVTVTVSPRLCLDVPEALMGKARRVALTASLRDAMEHAVYSARPSGLNLTEALGQAARAHGLGRQATEDPVSGKLSYRRLIAGADVLGGLISEGTAPGDAVGVLLPTANAAALCMLGLASHGRVTAMLNATTGLAGLRAALRTAQLRRVVTSRTFLQKARLEESIASLSETVDVVYLEDVRRRVTPAMRLRGLIRAQFFAARPRVRRAADDAAVIMFTSGSSGTPKGVVLTHRNLLANVAQVAGRIGFGRADRVFNAMPMFHAFGLTAGFLLPAVSGIPVYLYPSPLHYATIPQSVYHWNATALFGTSTFLRGYARRAHAQAFRSVRLVVAGAERVQQAVREIWMEKFGLRILEGYGATECAPVLALNTPAANRHGTVGRLLPGMALRLEPVDGVQGAGRLSVSGPNVMAGYLLADAPGVLHAPAEGWYDTGDIVSLDRDGHVSIVGRAARFAKTGGEMVSLAALEDVAASVWPEDASVAVAVPDARKGERVVLMTERRDAARSDFVAAARAAGLPEVAMPAELRVVEKLPVLGSGKLDYVAARELVSG